MIRKSVAFAAAALLVVHHAARADDPPAPKPPAPAAPGEPAKPAVPTAPGTNPAAKRHENKISPEAKAAFEKMEKVSNCPVRQGLKEAAGTVEMEMMGMPMSMKFTFEAPEKVRVETDPDAQGPMAMAGKQMSRGLERTLRPMLGINRPADEDEFDAEFVKQDGRELLQITTYKQDVEQARTRLTLDANGLIASGTTTSQTQSPAQDKREVKAEFTFTWAKVGERYRLEKIETSETGGRGPGGGGQGGGGGRGMGGGMGGGKVTISYTYTEVGDFAIATSWKVSMGDGVMVIDQRVTELTVNGRKVEIKKPEAPAAPPVPTDGGEGAKEGK